MKAVIERPRQKDEDSPVLFITYAWDGPDDDALVEDVSPTLKETRHWMEGRHGFVYRYERQPDGSYANQQFVEAL